MGGQQARDGSKEEGSKDENLSIGGGAIEGRGYKLI